MTSNKTQTLVKSTVSNEAAYQEPMSKPLVSSPFIDKLSVTLTLPVDIREMVTENVKKAIQYKSVFQYAKASPRFYLARMISLNDTAERVLFNYAPRAPGIPDCRMEFNPHKVGPKAILALNSLLMEVFPHGWDYVVSHARIKAPASPRGRQVLC